MKATNHFHGGACHSLTDLTRCATTLLFTLYHHTLWVCVRVAETMGKRTTKSSRSQTLPSSPSHSISSSSSSDFEFTISVSPHQASTALCPADELFYKGQLLPLHLSPRLSMVRTLILASSRTSSSSSETNSTTASRDSTESHSSFNSGILLFADCDSSRPSSVTEDDECRARFGYRKFLQCLEKNRRKTIQSLKLYPDRTSRKLAPPRRKFSGSIWRKSIRYTEKIHKSSNSNRNGRRKQIDLVKRTNHQTLNFQAATPEKKADREQYRTHFPVIWDIRE